MYNERLPSIVITGASGFIGRHFVIAVSEKFRLFCIARRSQKEVGIPHHVNIHWLQVDITNRKHLLNAFNYIKDQGGADYVLHLASYYDFTMKENPAYEHINIAGTRNVLEMSKRLGIKRFIFPSSVAACKFPPKDKALTEESLADADFAYARCKSIAEKMMSEYSEVFPCSIVRLAAVYSDWCEYPMLYMLLKLWLSGNRLMSRVVTGYGESAMPYIHIRDIIKLFMRIVELNDTLPRLAIYNASPQGCVSHNELFEAVTRYYYGHGVKPFRIPKFLAFLGLTIISFLGRLNSKKTLEQPWMADYIDKKLNVNASATYNALGWKPTPRYHILRRLLILTEKATSHPNDWTFRNEILLQRVAYRKSTFIYDILTELRESLVEEIIKEVMKPEYAQRFPNYRKMDPETLKWYITLNCQLVTATVKSRDRSIISAYAREIAYKHYFDGPGVKEVRDLWLLIGNTLKASLIARPELKDSGQRVDDHTILTSHLIADEFEDTMSAAAFAEAGEFDTAEQILDRDKKRKLRNSKQRVDDYIILTSQLAADEFEDMYEILADQHPERFVSIKEKNRAANWVKHVKQKYYITSSPCIHFLSGRIAFPEECSGNYSCHHCNVHALLDKESRSETIYTPTYKNISGYKMIEEYYYHFGHSWVNIEKFPHVKVGMDDFISKIFGPPDAINLPPIGTSIRQGDIGCVLNRNNKKAPMRSPLSGTVCGVNDKLKKHPEIAHDDPYHKGWLYMLYTENLVPELEGLYSGKECFQWMEKENQHLHKLMGPRYEQLAAVGGEPIDDIYGFLPEANWYRLVGKFLQTGIKQ
ncbi:MAG: NAD-dependent epimerase/dehydratase family protein [Desulfobacterales bacterium]|nr:NAD-dependent epimerase/dehydratase family protein [Desulfobacterales bacterium]